LRRWLGLGSEDAPSTVSGNAIYDEHGHQSGTNSTPHLTKVAFSGDTKPADDRLHPYSRKLRGSASHSETSMPSVRSRVSFTADTKRGHERNERAELHSHVPPVHAPPVHDAESPLPSPPPTPRLTPNKAHRHHKLHLRHREKRISKEQCSEVISHGKRNKTKEGCSEEWH
jgi:hypothetical protein